MFTLISITIAIAIAVLGFIAARLQKRRMRNALGRGVNDGDLFPDARRRSRRTPGERNEKTSRLIVR